MTGVHKLAHKVGAGSGLGLPPQPPDGASPQMLEHISHLFHGIYGAQFADVTPVARAPRHPAPRPPEREGLPPGRTDIRACPSAG